MQTKVEKDRQNIHENNINFFLFDLILNSKRYPILDHVFVR